MKLDNFYHLEYSDFCLRLYYYIHNVSVDGFGSKFCVGSRVRQETPEEGRKKHQLKHCEYKNEDEDNSPNIQSEKKKD